MTPAEKIRTRKRAPYSFGLESYRIPSRELQRATAKAIVCENAVSSCPLGMARRDSCTTQAPPNGSRFRLALPSRHRVLRQSPLPRGSGGPCGAERGGTLLALVIARYFLPQSRKSFLTRCSL